jgi:UDP-N-acetylmuramyl tripeptide synthase
VDIASSSSVSNFQFSQEQKMVKFTVEGRTGTTGVTQVTVPKAMLSGDMMVTVDGQVVTPDSNNVIVTSNTSTETTFELNYHHSQHEVTVTGTNVVPEFPASMLAMAAAIGSVSAFAALRGRMGL